MFSDPASNLNKLVLSEGMKVVDIGAGSGFYTLEAAKKVGASGRIYAVDVQKNLLERLRAVGAMQGLRNIEVIWGNAEKIGGTKVKEAIADRAIVSNILFQVKDADDLVLEVKRILKPGGKAMVIDWSESSALGPKDVMGEQEARMHFEKAGFVLEHSFDAGDHHYGMILSKP